MEGMQNMQGMQGGKGVCKCVHHQVVPFLIIVIGVTFLMGEWGTISWDSVNVIWPIAIILIGAMKVVAGMGVCKCCSKTSSNM